jgi:hypothetical protein
MIGLDQQRRRPGLIEIVVVGQLLHEVVYARSVLVPGPVEHRSLRVIALLVFVDDELDALADHAGSGRLRERGLHHDEICLNTVFRVQDVL